MNAGSTHSTWPIEGLAGSFALQLLQEGCDDPAG